MLNPEGSFRKFWSGFIASVTIVTAIEIPLRLAFRIENHWHILILESFLTAAYSLDIVFRFLTPVRVRRDWVTNPKEVAKIYLKGWFWIDLITALPIFIWAGPLYAGINRAIRFLHFFRFHHSTNMTKLSLMLDKWFPGHLVKPSVIRLALFAFGLTLLAHWIACGWILLRGTHGPIIQVYSDALYWTITTLTTVGYGDITPEHILEKYYTMLVMVIGVGSYGYVIGNMASFLSNLDLMQANHIQKMEKINAFLNYRNVPMNLQKQIYEFYGHVWDHRMDMGEAQILAELPNVLKTETALFLYRDILTKVPYFKKASPDLIRDIAINLKALVLPPGTVFIRYGEIGDSMFFISYGEVEVLSQDFKKRYAILREGDFVGETALILNEPRNANVRTIGYCDLYELSQESFKRIIAKYPDFQKHIRVIIEERQRNREA